MGIDLDLWELPKPQQKKVLGIGYSSVYLTNEDKNMLSYRIWLKMIHQCYSLSESNSRNLKRNYECCNSWLDYQKFAKWFHKNCKDCHRNDMLLTKCVISKDNTTFNPNNCAVVPKEIYTYLERANSNKDKAKGLAEKYKDYIMDDIYELLAEDFDYE